MSYVLNPFALVAETDDAFIICTADRIRVQLPKHNKPLIDRFLSGAPMTREVLEQHVSQRRLNELLQKRLLVNGNAPPLEGRYSRQLGFFSLTSADFRQQQQRIADAHVLILGAGALGSHVAWNLAAIGVGRITIVDFDTIEETNLNRQLMYTPADIGYPKVEVLCRRLREFNPEIELHAVNMKISSAADIDGLMDGKTVLVKAIDTPDESTPWTNEVCVTRGIPFITGGFLDYVGVIGPIYVPGRSICFACMQSAQFKRLHGTGPTFAPLATIVSSMIAMCVYRIIVGESDALIDKVFMYDSRTAAWQTSDMQSRRTCDLCGHPPTVTAPPERRPDRKLWFYRGTILSLMAVGAAIMGLGHDRFTGILVFLAFFASLPALDLAVDGDPLRFRREAFVISCLYCITNLVFAGLLRLPGAHFSFRFSLAGFFGVVQQICASAIVAVIAITLVFLLAVMYMAAFKRVTNSSQAWFS